MSKCENALVNAIIYNGDFASKKVNAEQVDNSILDTFKKSEQMLLTALYNVTAKAQNYKLTGEEDYTEVFAALQSIRALLGTVNGYKIICDINDVIALSPYALRDVNNDAPELQLVCTRLSNDTRLLKQYQSTQGVSPDAIAALEESIEKWTAEKARLLDVAKMRTKKAVPATLDSFRLHLEHFYARKFAQMSTVSYAEYMEERDAIRKAKKEAKSK